MPTLVQLRTYTRDWLGTSSTRLSDGSLTQIINVAMREIEKRRDIWATETSTTVNVVAGTPNYAISTMGTGDPARFIALTFPSSDGESLVTLNEISYEQFLKDYGSAAMSSGTPVEFAVYGDSVYLGPTPDTSFTMTVYYHVMWADLSADTDNNAVTNFAWEALLFKACALASKYMFEDERALMFEEMYESQLRKLDWESSIRRYASKQFSQMQEPG